MRGGKNPVGAIRLQVALVDDVSLYTRRLLDGFKELGTETVLYGPISSPPTKSSEIMETLGPDGIKVWTQNLLPLQVFARSAKDRPRILHIQFEFYGIHSYGPFYASVGISVLLLMLHLLRVKTVVTLHSVLPRGGQLRRIRDISPSSKRIPTILIEAFLLLVYRSITNLASAVVVHAEVFKKRLVQQYSVKPSKIRVIPHGVETIVKSGYLERRHPEAGPSLILYFGVISPRKGLETLLAAFGLLLQKQTSNCELWLAGSSPPYYHGYQTRLRNLASELGPASKVRFLGTVDSAYAHQLFTQAKFMVLPYSYDVSASGALSWALGHGLPVIVSDTEYFAEELSMSEFGLKVPLGDPRMLADAMEILLAQGALRKVFSKNAREMGSLRSWQAVAKATLGFYQDLLK